MDRIEFLPNDPLAAKAAMGLFQGYSKIQGMLRCRALDLPTLPGLVVDPSRVSDREAVAAASAIDAENYLIRHDKSPEAGTYPQGGYVIRAEDLPAELEWYRNQGRLVVILAPADPFDNLYSASVLLTVDDSLQIEIVGPGFDASDINRGIISPLESRRLRMDADGKARYLSKNTIDKDAYRLAKSLRIRKIALKFILKRRSFNLEEIDETDARRLLESDLRSSKPQLRHLLSDETYAPAPSSFLNRVTRFARIIKTSLNLRREGETMAAFSTSVVENGARTVVWDIVLPKRKYALA